MTINDRYADTKKLFISNQKKTQKTQSNRSIHYQKNKRMSLDMKYNFLDNIDAWES